MAWLLEQVVLDAMASAAARHNITADQFRDFEARVRADRDGGDPPILSVSGGLASITISGVMTAKPDFMAWLFGGGNTTYAEIVEAVEAADSMADSMELYVDTPGGSVDGLFEAMAAIKNASIPVKAIVSNKAASAGYGLVSQADEIVAANEAARFGSIGTAAEIRVNDDTVTITSSNAPDKRPDVTTEEGRATVRAELDGIADLFASRIAEGRGVDAYVVNTTFGRGRMLLAGEALKLGIFDGVKTQSARADNSNPANTSGTQPEATMDLKELEAKHRDVYEAAVNLGIAQERDRVSAHLELGRAYNAMDTAVTAVTNGDGMTALLTAKYVAAGANKGAVDARQEDDKDADPGTSAASGEEEDTQARDEKAADAIAAHAFELCGVEMKEGA